MKYFFSILFFAFNLFSFEETIKKEFSSKGIEKVLVENVNGDIEIYGDDGKQILIEAIKKADKERNLKNLNVKIFRKEKTLNIKTEHTRSYFLGFLPVKMGGSVKYKISLPSGMNLKIETVNGSILIEKVDGLIEAESVNGDLNLKEVFGKGKFETVNGSIKIKIKDEFPNFNAESVNGDIYIKSLKKINANYSIEVVNGKIKIIPEIMEIKSSTTKEITGKWGDGRGKVDIETVNGNVTIEIEEEKFI